jgi:hypothetical protein
MFMHGRDLLTIAAPAVLAVHLACSSSTTANIVTFEFAAASTFSTHSTFGLPAPTGPVIGRFSYDPQSASHFIEVEDSEALGYRQQIAGGFTATFGDVTVSAGDYVLELFDDLPQPGDQVADVVTIIYSSDLTPPPTTPLLVNGVPQAAGQLLVSFLQYGGSQFDVPSLAELDGLENFGWAIALLGDTGHRTSSADVAAVLESLSTPMFPTADLDEDADVDGNDFLLWQRSVGQGGAPHFTVWQGEFPAGSVQGSVIPEPAAAALAVIVLLSWPWFTRK